MTDETEKDIKEYELNKDMSKSYRTFSSALKNRRIDEITVYDYKTKAYYNIKKRTSRRLGW